MLMLDRRGVLRAKLMGPSCLCPALPMITQTATDQLWPFLVQGHARRWVVMEGRHSSERILDTGFFWHPCRLGTERMQPAKWTVQKGIR